MTYQKRTKGVKIGLCICRYDPQLAIDTNSDSKKKDEKLGKSRSRSPSPSKNIVHIDK